MKAKELREKSVEELNTELHHVVDAHILIGACQLLAAGCKWPAATVSPVEASASRCRTR